MRNAVYNPGCQTSCNPQQAFIYQRNDFMASTARDNLSYFSDRDYITSKLIRTIWHSFLTGTISQGSQQGQSGTVFLQGPYHQEVKRDNLTQYSYREHITRKLVATICAKWLQNLKQSSQLEFEHFNMNKLIILYQVAINVVLYHRKKQTNIISD